eukprot:754318-Hanusia_phi.AAC.4
MTPRTNFVRIPKTSGVERGIESTSGGADWARQKEERAVMGGREMRTSFLEFQQLEVGMGVHPGEGSLGRGSHLQRGSL